MDAALRPCAELYIQNWRKRVSILVLMDAALRLPLPLPFVLS